MLDINGRAYAWPERPVVVICLDGSEPSYMDRALAAGLMPELAEIKKRGSSVGAYAALPTFTNPNNVSIITGVPSARHGICGNFFFDQSAGEEIMMNDAGLMWGTTVLREFAANGASVAAVTAKDKLLNLLGQGLESNIRFSAEKSGQSSKAKNGIEDVLGLVGKEQPDVYSAELSEFVLAAGVRLLEEYRPDLLYLSTTDFVQHMYGPDDQEALDFYAMVDGYLGQLVKADVALVLTADHGMKAKTDSAGAPCVLYVEEYLEETYGEGASRVILPITDPYVKHHGALGSFCTVYLREDLNPTAIARALMELEGIDLALSADEGAAIFDLPRDRTGDVIVFSGSQWVLGRTPGHHDLGSLDRPLRSHGGLWEREVPFITNRPIKAFSSTSKVRNYDAFFVACNHMP